MASQTTKRIPFWDNMKGLLIVLVVYGHILEQMKSVESLFLYKGIYLFHMPLFVFCSGYLAKFSPKRIAKRILLPYLIFQLVSCLFSSSGHIQFTTPVWTLWYLLALFVWTLSIPFLEECPNRFRPFVIIGAFLLGELCGMDETVGYYLSISRILVFFPFFILGYYGKGWVCRNGFGQDLWQSGRFFQNNRVRAASVLALFAAIALFVLIEPFIQVKWLYGSYSYSRGEYGMGYRLAGYLIACLVGFFLIVWVPKVKTFLTWFGANSMVIYLFHTFWIELLKFYFPELAKHHWSGILPGCLLLTVAICCTILGFQNGVLTFWKKALHSGTDGSRLSAE